MSLREIVNVQISKETTAVSRAGFGVMMVMGAHKIFNERLRFYTAASAMLTDGFESTDPEYIAVNAALSQDPRPEQVAVGRRTVDSAGISIDTVVASTDYTVTINGTNFTFGSGGSPTAITIAAGLVAAINAGAEPVTATDDLDGTFVVAADVAGVAFSMVVVGTNLSVEKPLTASDTIPNDLAAIQVENDDWYALVLTSHVQTDVEAAALWIESEKKIFISSTSDTDTLDSGATTDVGAVLQAAAYDRSSIDYHTTPATFMEAAELGKQLPTDPGSTTWKFKTFNGVSAITLTATESINARNKNVNTYELVGGVNILREGKMASGEFLDIIRGIDWLESRMTERIFSRLVNLPKVPLTDGGIAIIEAEVRAQLSEGIDNGLIAADPAPEVTVPLAADISAANKAARILPDITFKATLAGAVHFVEINGTVTV